MTRLYEILLTLGILGLVVLLGYSINYWLDKGLNKIDKMFGLRK